MPQEIRVIVQSFTATRAGKRGETYSTVFPAGVKITMLDEPAFWAAGEPDVLYRTFSPEGDSTQYKMKAEDLTRYTRRASKGECSVACGHPHE